VAVAVVDQVMEPPTVVVVAVVDEFVMLWDFR
jgi:hypothetical protein